MTAALIILLCLSIDIPPFLCHGHELQTILRERTQAHSQCSQVEPLMRLAGMWPLMRPCLSGCYIYVVIFLYNYSSHFTHTMCALKCKRKQSITFVMFLP